MSIGLDGLGRLAYVLKRAGDRGQDLPRTPPMDSKPSALAHQTSGHMILPSRIFQLPKFGKLVIETKLQQNKCPPVGAYTL